MKRSQKIFRPSLENMGCLIATLFGLVALFWFAFAAAEYSVRDEPRVWPALIFLPFFILPVAYVLMRLLQTRIVLDVEKIVFYDGRKRKEVRYENLDRARYDSIGGFDAGFSEFIFLCLWHQADEIDKDSYADIIQHFRFVIPERTVTLDISPFDRRTIAKTMLSLSVLSPQTRVIIPIWDKWELERWQGVFNKIGGRIEQSSSPNEWVVKQTVLQSHT